jgi:Kef-type K+ transport system membrane component KefB/nucleotide-binding universal stress UspA family protein
MPFAANSVAAAAMPAPRRRPWAHARLALAAAAVTVLATAPALAEVAGEETKGPSVVIFLAQLLLLMLVGRLLGEAMLRIKQPAVMGQLIAGLILGPSLFGALFPGTHDLLFPKAHDQKAMIDGIAQFGVLLLLLITGMETDLKLVRQTGRASVYASLMGIVIPFACGVGLGLALPDSLIGDPQKRVVTALFLGTALSIASVNFVAMIVREMNFTRRTVGQVILASAVIDDSIGWIMVSIIFSLAAAGKVEPWALAESILGTLVFLAVSLTIGRRAVFFAIRFVNDTFKSDFAVITAILAIMGTMSLITYSIGVHTVLGAFVAGVLIGESPILSRHIDEQLRGLVMAFFTPIYFGLAGQSADITVLANPTIAIYTVGLVAIASLGKFGGAFIGGELGGLTRREGVALACGMNARGSTEVIIATVGLSMGALSSQLFTMIVAMAIITTMAMPPTLRWALARVPMRKEEKQRLEREEMEAKGFVPKLERLLLAIDDSANGQFATRIGGIVAGANAMPTTVMHIHGKKRPSKTAVVQAKEKAKAIGETVQVVAGRSDQSKRDEEKTETKIDVTTMVEKAPKTEAIAAEAEKGYDLLIVGLDKTVDNKNEFTDDITNLAAGFEGPIAVVEARDGQLDDPLHSRLSILVPVNGTDASRRAAEVAIAIARAAKAPLTALYVAPSGKNKTRRSGQYEEAILKDIVALADSYSLQIKTAVRTDVAADEAIVKEMGRRRNNLLVLGVGRRPGDKLFFGDTAAALLEKSTKSLVFVAT